MMKTALLTFALALVTCASNQSLLAVQNCNDQDFNGNYGIVAHGAVTAPGFPITGPFARAGRVLADGQGSVTFETTASYNGYLFTEALTATYSVSPDCTIVFNVQPFAPIYQNAVFKGVLSDNKRQVNFMIAEPLFQTISAVLTKQDSQVCNARSLSGPYALHMTGNIVVAPAGLQPGEFVRVGKFVPDGKGNFSAETNANYNGFVIRAEALAGTFAVNADCTVNIQYTYDGVPYTWHGAVAENGKRLEVVVAKDGFAVAGELIGQ